MEGDFRLSLVKGKIEAPVSSNEEQVIDYYQTITAYLNRNQEGKFKFKGTQGDQITITVQGEFDSNLTLRDTSGRLLITDDDSGGGGQPKIELFTLPATGEYQILVRGYSVNSLGSYNITLIKSEAAFAETSNLQYGMTVNGRLKAGDKVAYTFSGKAGDRISITVTSAIDLNLLLRDDQGGKVAEDDDSGGNMQPALTNFALARTGSYTIIISSFTPTDEGPFTLTLSGPSQ
jgi:hypothetical protein